MTVAEATLQYLGQQGPLVNVWAFVLVMDFHCRLVCRPNMNVTDTGVLLQRMYCLLMLLSFQQFMELGCMYTHTSSQRYIICNIQ